MTTTFYDEFFTYDLASMDSASFTLALLKSTYTPDLTETSSATVLGDESAGSGYARITGVSIKKDTSSGRATLYKLDKSGAPSFATFTTTDWQYLLVYDPTGGHPLALFDNGAPSSVTGQALIVSGDILAITG